MARLLLPTLLLLSLACGEASEDDVNNTPSSDNMMSSNNSAPSNHTTPSNNPMPSNNMMSSNDTTPEVARWAGTWFADLAYTVTCEESFREDKTETLVGTWTVTITGANDALAAEVSGNHFLEGAGRGDRLTLTGTWPLKSTENDREASTIPRDTRITLLVDDVLSRDEARGEVSGSFETSDFVYSDCVIDAGTVTLTR